jgi:outer membrane protein assembly factor BamB
VGEEAFTMKTSMKTISILTVFLAVGMVMAAFAPSMAPSSGGSPDASIFRYDQKRTGNSGLVSDITNPEARWIFDSGSAAGSSPTVGDINNDGKTEIVWGSEDGTVYALDENGAVIWTYLGVGPFYAPPGIADVDGDGINEVIIGGYYLNSGDPDLYALNGEDGSLLWIFTTSDKGATTEKGFEAGPAFYDINGNGGLDILIGSFNHIFYALDGHDGSILWENQFEHFIRITAPIGDIDKDGKDELLVSDNHALTRLFEMDGSLDWEVYAGYGVVSTPILADVDGDGWDEIIMFSYGWNAIGRPGGLRVINHDGTLLWINSDYQFSYSTPAIFDVDGDGLVDIINVHSHDQILIAYKGTDGSILYTDEPFEKNFMQPGLITADIDGDGETEILVSGNPNLFSINPSDGSVEWVYDSGGVRVSGTMVADIDGDGLAEILIRLGGTVVCLQNGFDPLDLLDEIIEYILGLPDECFKNNADNRKNALVNKLEEVRQMILDGDYEGAIEKLENDIRPKMDGEGNNDWIICEDAQEDLTGMIDRLIEHLESLL